MHNIEAVSGIETKDQRKAVVLDFLKRSNAYAHDVLNKLNSEGLCETLSAKQKASIYVELSQWTSYIHFNEVAIRELNGSKLDSWFELTTPSQAPLDG